MRARYYEPLTGRFLSEDPARAGANRCLYADGNPVLTKLANLHAIDSTAAKLLQHVFEGIESFIAAIAGFSETC